MSYAINFLDPEPGQSWEDAMDALEERSAGPDVLTRPPHWDLVVAKVRELLGDISVMEDPPAWEIIHEAMALQVYCISGEWSLSVPYWSEGDAALSLLRRIHAVCEIIQTVTGLQAYDPQSGEAVLSDGWTEELAVTAFDDSADLFRSLGITRGSSRRKFGRSGGLTRLANGRLARFFR
ncbi:hypothetical protein [Actinomadura meridiana]|uniref:hypothetical protein n=1 Tax=Actinomadura meridiana TaxID=559626 RepID=UPI0031EACA37